MSETAGLRWRCRRGMKEIDLLLLAWLDQEWPGADAGQRQAFEAMLELPDPELLAYLLGRERPTDGGIADVVAQIRRLPLA